MCKNLSAAALILQDNFTRASVKEGASQQALKKALSAYNTGDFARGVKNGYVQKVSTNGIKIAQGYAVPAIQLDPKDVAPSPTATDTQPAKATVAAPQPGASAKSKTAPKTPAGGSTTTDPSMVFGSPPAGEDEEAAQALVF